MPNKIIETIKRWFKKESSQSLDRAEQPEENLLKELCGADARLYGVLSSFLYLNPLRNISEKDLDVLVGEAEATGNFKLAAEKAFFEASQNPGDRARYVKVIQNLMPKTIQVLGQEKEKAEKEGLPDRAATVAKRIANQQFISERVEDVINIASKFYTEKLLELAEKERKTVREKKIADDEMIERRIEKSEKRRGEERVEERKKMGKEEKREAEEQDKKESLATEKRKKTKATQTTDNETEERRIEESEKAGREARRKERKG